MSNENPWDSLDNMLDKLSCNDARNVPKICHHYPRRSSINFDENESMLKELYDFQVRTYDDRTRTGIYIEGNLYWGPILEDHPEIRYLAYLNKEIDDEVLTAIRSIRADDTLIFRGFSIRDRDSRAPESSYYFLDDLPSEENVRPIVNYLKEWHSAGAPSLLTCCSAGMFRSTVTALVAHSMITGNPMASAIRLVMAGNPFCGIDSNWEIARIADPMLGFDGLLHAATLNVQRASIERSRLLKEGTTLEELLNRLEKIFANPWEEEQVLEYHKNHG